jgi:hypothetical protein
MVIVKAELEPADWDRNDALPNNTGSEPTSWVSSQSVL